MKTKTIAKLKLNDSSIEFHSKYAMSRTTGENSTVFCSGLTYNIETAFEDFKKTVWYDESLSYHCYYSNSVHKTIVIKVIDTPKVFNNYTLELV